MSTSEQGCSGLGLAAQRRDIELSFEAAAQRLHSGHSCTDDGCAWPLYHQPPYTCPGTNAEVMIHPSGITLIRPSDRLLPAALLKEYFVTARCSIVSSIDRIKRQKRANFGRYTKSDNVKGLTQALTTFASLALFWWVAILGVGVSRWLTAAAMLLITLFNVRVFALMHECGHGSLFRSPWLNRAIGFLLGVVSGMPQYVWSQHHSYHHAHNGNWDKYRGPYTTPSIGEYEAMTDAQRRMYRLKCNIAVAPLVGFIYLIFNPRFTWAKGSIGLVIHMVRKKAAQPNVSMKNHAATYETRYWESSKEYWHMFWNNVVLLTLWVLMCWAVGTTLFFTIYLISLSIAGGAGIILFTVQHNFEHAYASDSKRWDYTTGAIQGTCFLVLPRWLNWLTVDMGYHHIHHLSAKIPNYCLAKCHNEYQHLFTDVTRLKLSQFPNALKCILWDTRAQRIISVSEHQKQI
jgi:acyl-lipid omega-6 desaturase (Delta-12 desaturase)